MTTPVCAHFNAILLMFGLSFSLVATAVTPKAPNPPGPLGPPPQAASSAPVTIEAITQLSRQKLAETLKTEVIVARAAGVKAERDSVAASATAAAAVAAAAASMPGYQAPQRVQKKVKEEPLSLPGVVAIAGVGPRLEATLNNGRTVVTGDAFRLGDAQVTVESISKQVVTFKRCEKSDCVRVPTKVAGS